MGRKTSGGTRTRATHRIAARTATTNTSVRSAAASRRGSRRRMRSGSGAKRCLSGRSAKSGDQVGGGLGEVGLAHSRVELVRLEPSGSEVFGECRRGLLPFHGADADSAGNGWLWMTDVAHVVASDPVCNTVILATV